jgi:uncharacterized protein
LKRHGFVGIGRIKKRAKMIKDVTIRGKSLLNLCSNMADNYDNHDLSEYVALVEWLKTVPRDKAKWRSTPKLYTTTHVRALLDGQQGTIKFIEEQFGVSMRDLVV